jgi:RES domain-containing protein
MIVYRICNEKYADLSGIGAMRYGGRWNSPGFPIVYTASSRALAMAELYVHVSPLALKNVNYVCIEIELPPNCSKILSKNNLPEDWHRTPPQSILATFGDMWISGGKCLALRVPSAVVAGDYNYLVNPHHMDMGKVKIKSTAHFPFDKRLVK